MATDPAMIESTASLGQLAATSKDLAQQLLTVGENRLELLAVELQEEHERLLHAFLLGLGVAASGLLSGLTLTAAIVVLWWDDSPVAVLLTLAVLYGVAAACLCWRLNALLRDWQTFAASLDQLRKDRASLEDILS
jgi:uncharacterized membrane protein YqjE